MNRQILDLYTWETGVCFRHPGEGRQPTAYLRTIHPAAGGAEELRACRGCVVALEAEKCRAAERAGIHYRPGTIGDDASRCSSEAPFGASQRGGSGE